MAGSWVYTDVVLDLFNRDAFFWKVFRPIMQASNCTSDVSDPGSCVLSTVYTSQVHPESKMTFSLTVTPTSIRGSLYRESENVLFTFRADPETCEWLFKSLKSFIPKELTFVECLEQLRRSYEE